MSREKFGYRYMIDERALRHSHRRELERNYREEAVLKVGKAYVEKYAKWEKSYVYKSVRTGQLEFYKEHQFHADLRFYGEEYQTEINPPELE